LAVWPSCGSLPAKVSSCISSRARRTWSPAGNFCLDIDDLDETRNRLQAAGLQPYDAAPIPNRPRFFCRDPAGNLVEFTSLEGDYRE
jgi:hypothetical protein